MITASKRDRGDGRSAHRRGRVERGRGARAGRVLVVDDDAESRIALGALLEQAGMNVALAASVPQALRALDTFVPDLVVSDLVMPQQDGFALIRAIRGPEEKSGDHVEVVALTAVTDSKVRRRAIEAGFDAYLEKPLDASLVLEVAARAVRAASP